MPVCKHCNSNIPYEGGVIVSGKLEYCSLTCFAVRVLEPDPTDANPKNELHGGCVVCQKLIYNVGPVHIPDPDDAGMWFCPDCCPPDEIVKKVRLQDGDYYVCTHCGMRYLISTFPLWLSAFDNGVYCSLACRQGSRNGIRKPSPANLWDHLTFGGSSDHT